MWRGRKRWSGGIVRDETSVAPSPLGDISRYMIKSAYIERKAPEYFEDAPDGVVYQPDVYSLAGVIGNLAGARYLVDLGCGFATKLIDSSSQHSLIPIGIDYGGNIAHCRKTYPENRWLELDFEDPKFDLLSPEVLQQSVILSSDVIEHLIDPTFLVSLLREWLRFARVGLMSTPERDVRWGIEHNGPPPNPHHVREWNAEELTAYLEASGLTVSFTGLTRSKNTGYGMWTQVLLLGPTMAPR